MSGSTLPQFAQRMMLLGINVEKNAIEMVRKVALAVDQAVVMATPVDTGRARSNWLVSVGSANQGEIDPYNPGIGGSTGADNIRQAIEQAKAAVASYQGGTAIYISNNLSYIQKLNEGWSRQAPAGYVQAAAQAAAAVLGATRLLTP